MIYTLTLNPAIDYVVQLDHPLTSGAINRTHAEVFQFGGKGINVSNVLRTLGQPTTALGFIAGFTGLGLEEELQKSGLATDFIRLPEGNTRINMKIKGSEETEINGSGPAIQEEAFCRLFAQLDKLVSGDVLVLSGSAPKSVSADIYASILRRLTGKAIATVVDASGPLLTKTLPHHPFLIKPNRQELEELFCTALSSDEEILSCARKLQMQGARNVLVSLAGQGALLLDEAGKVHRKPCPSGQIVNSVGAGDSMVAGFIAGWLQTGDYDYALRLGIAAGSATAFSLGLADKAAIDALL